jgi:hypothetical protein
VERDSDLSLERRALDEMIASRLVAMFPYRSSSSQSIWKEIGSHNNPSGARGQGVELEGLFPRQLALVAILPKPSSHPASVEMCEFVCVPWLSSLFGTALELGYVNHGTNFITFYEIV